MCRERLYRGWGHIIGDSGLGPELMLLNRHEAWIASMHLWTDAQGAQSRVNQSSLIFSTFVDWGLVSCDKSVPPSSARTHRLCAIIVIFRRSRTVRERARTEVCRTYSLALSNALILHGFSCDKPPLAAATPLWL